MVSVRSHCCYCYCYYKMNCMYPIRIWHMINDLWSVERVSYTHKHSSLVRPSGISYLILFLRPKMIFSIGESILLILLFYKTQKRTGYRLLHKYQIKMYIYVWYKWLYSARTRTYVWHVCCNVILCIILNIIQLEWKIKIDEENTKIWLIILVTVCRSHSPRII